MPLSQVTPELVLSDHASLMLSICQKEGYSVAELTDIQNELR